MLNAEPAPAPAPKAPNVTFETLAVIAPWLIWLLLTAAEGIPVLSAAIVSVFDAELPKAKALTVLLATLTRSLVV